MTAMSQRTPQDTDPAAGNAEDELADDDLESVSGGMFPAGMKGTGGIVTGPIDVCKVPVPSGPVPLPYPNILSPSTAKKP